MNEREIGASGLIAFHGLVSEAYTSTLEWPGAYDVYDEMRRRDPTIRTLWNAMVLLAGTASWYVEPGGTADADKAAAEFVQTCVEDMSHTLEAGIEDALTCVLFGWAWAEICYKRRSGPNGRHASEHDDGRIGWRKWAVRRQSSFERWEFDETGGVAGMVQRPAPDYEEITLPIEKSLHFVAQRDGGNPEGWPLLESLYEVWYYLKNYQIIQGIGWQRSFWGLPVFEFEETPSADDKAQVKAVGEGLTIDAKQYVSVPKSVKFRLETVQNAGAEALLNTIRYYRLQMLQTVMADFINLGTGQTGSWALGSDKSQLFLMAVDGFLDRVVSPINRFGVPRLMAYNSFPGMTGRPKLVHTRVEKPALGQLGNWLQQVSGLLEWTPEDEMWLRKRGGMPTITSGNLSTSPQGREGGAGPSPGSPRLPSEDGERGMAELAEGEGLSAERGEIEEELAGEVGRFLSGQGRRVGKEIGNGRTEIGDEDGFWEEEEGGLYKTILPLLTAILNTLAGYAADDFEQEYGIGLDWSLANADAMRWARKHVGKLVTGVTDVTRGNVREAVASWIETGGTLRDLAKTLEPTFGERRAGLIAQTETTRAYAEANDRLWGTSGIIEEWDWATVRAGNVCPICKGNAKEGPYPLGKGPDMPAHPGCRCWKRPVVEIGD